MEGMLGQTSVDQSWFEDWGLSVLVTLATALIITIAIKIAVARFRRKLEGTPNLTQELNLQRIATLTGALSATALAIVWTIAAPPAVVNAIVDAVSHLGVTEIGKPATPERVWKAIRDAKGGAA